MCWVSAGCSLWESVWDCLGNRRCAACDDLLQPGASVKALCATCFDLCEPFVGRGPLFDDAPPCYSAFHYDGPLAQALIRFKWHGRDDLAEPLGKLLRPLVAEHLRTHDYLVPVPLHPARLRQRGYNQATLLAKSALPNRGMRRKLCVTGLTVTKPNQPARRLGRSARFERVADHFVSSAAHLLGGKRVLLVDDVITTGATVAACAKALSAIGVSHVSAVSLLRVSPA